MKILVVTDGISPYVVGGMQKHSAGLIKYLALRGHDVTMIHCLPSGTNKPSHEEIRESMGLSQEASLKIITLYFPPSGFLPGHYLKSSYQFSNKAFDAVQKEIDSFDFIYTKGFTGWYFIAQKLKGKKLPPIGVKFHGYEMFQPGGSFTMKLKKYLLKGTVQWISQHADVVFSYGSKITEVIKRIGVDPNRIVEVPTGIEAHWIANQKTRSTTPRKFLFIGRYERRKGIEELHAAILSREENSEVEFHFIGPIDHSKRVKRKDIIYHGEIKEAGKIIEIMDECHVLLCPSHSEGMPNVIMEAMSRGMAVIATTVGAVDRLVDESTGWLIAPGDTEALKESIQTAVNETHSAIQAKGNNAIQKVKDQFLWEKIIELTERNIEKSRVNS
jgi:glycosyltransferase involved in cell wall biosynthesis